MTTVPDITLNNGVRIPQLGFGVFQIEPDQTREAVATALEIGYRHIDTAEMYGNERGVGEAIRGSGLQRDEVFVTSKLSNDNHAYDDALQAFEETLARVDIDYLDLFIIHWPLPAVGDFLQTWRALEEMARSGRVRAVGVSNFQVAHLERVLANTDTVPAVNQIEVHPYLTNEAVRTFCVEHQIAVEAYSPIAQGQVLEDPAITAIAEQVGKSAAQVTLRWHLQRGDIIFPKSVTRERVEANFDLFDFALDDDQLAAISALNRDERTGQDPDTFNAVPED